MRPRLRSAPSLGRCSSQVSTLTPTLNLRTLHPTSHLPPPTSYLPPSTSHLSPSPRGEEIDFDEWMSKWIADNYPGEDPPAEAKDLVRDALSVHVHEVVLQNYASLEKELVEFL